MNLSSLHELSSFALLGPAFNNGTQFTLLTNLRETRESPRLVYVPFEGSGATPLTFVGRDETVDLVVDLDRPAPLVTASLDANGYASMVNKIREAIAAGDVYQVCYTVRAKLESVTGADIVAAMCCRAIPRFLAWVRLPNGVEFVSSSPELFFETHGCHIRTEPMKGTASPQSAEFLAADQKNAAELAMITDLLRNDLTQVCRPRSVRVACEKRILELPYAVQMVSDIVGELPNHTSPLDALAALHPGGSVTGAPKQAALAMIRTLEAEAGPRQAYTGALGLLTNGESRFSLLIRTAMRTERGWVYGVGSGVVYDSDPDTELAELNIKLGALTG